MKQFIVNNMHVYKRMLSPYLAYFLGILTILIPLLIFFVLSLNFDGVNSAWNNFFCG